MIDYMIEIAKDKRLDTLYALMMRENYRAIRLMRKKGFQIESEQGETVRGVIKL